MEAYNTTVIPPLPNGNTIAGVMRPRQPDYWTSTTSSSRSQSYYVPRDGAEDYSDYWAEKTDPDGSPRNRLTTVERLTYLSDVEEELRFVSTLKPGRILDVGCGPGWFLSAIGQKWQKCGTEICEDAARMATSAGVEMLSADLREQESGTFDVVVMHHVIEHLRDPCGMVAQVRRLLRTGGKLVLGTPDFWSPCALRFGDNYRLLHDPTHISLFSNESVHRLLVDYGFSVNDVKYPFPKRYATAETFARWNDPTKVSPPWPGNFMTFYATKGRA